MKTKRFILNAVLAGVVFLFSTDTTGLAQDLSAAWGGMDQAGDGFGFDSPFLLAKAGWTGASPSEDKDQAVDDGLDLFEEYDDSLVQEAMVPDPLYYFNYAMYSLNDVLYFYAIKPVGQGYKAIVPTIVRKGIRNFFHNLLFPVRFVNNLLQGKVVNASNEFGIFLVNTTFGILGFNQYAQEHIDIKTNAEDLGQTFGTWSIGEGFYLVLPFFGPTTARDALGRAGDLFITPLNYIEPWELYWGTTGLRAVNDSSFRIGDYEALKQAALDPYAALKNAYIQNRRAAILK